MCILHTPSDQSLAPSWGDSADLALHTHGLVTVEALRVLCDLPSVGWSVWMSAHHAFVLLSIIQSHRRRAPAANGHLSCFQFCLLLCQVLLCKYRGSGLLAHRVALWLFFL